MKERVFFYRHLFIVFGLCTALLIWVNKTQFSQQPLFNATRYQFTPPFFKLITFGFWPAAVDGMWIETVQLLSSQNINSLVKEEASSFFDLATDLDPNFYELYEYAGIYFGVMGDDSERSIHYFQKGIQVFETKHPPKAFWTHPFSLYIFEGYVQAFEKNDWEAAKKSYLLAAEVPNAPQYLQSMKSWLKEAGAEKNLAKRVLTILIRNTSDDKVKEKLKEKLAHYE